MHEVRKHPTQYRAVVRRSGDIASLYCVIALCVISCSSNAAPENTATSPETIYKALTDNFPRLSGPETELLMELGLCVDELSLIHGEDNIEYDYCDSREYRIIKLAGSGHSFDVVAIETSSTHYAGSGGNRVYIYRLDGKKYTECRTFQGFVKGVRKKQFTNPDIVVAHYDKKVGEVLISHCWKNKNYAPCQLLAINQKIIAPEKYDSLYRKYIVNFGW
ncbi:MAG: hypothetical protein MJE77_12145 [Proteobacteria bacterium]|nr:hypothetical protein [Pseudomonadota bacterium]